MESDGVDVGGECDGIDYTVYLDKVYADRFLVIQHDHRSAYRALYSARESNNGEC